MRFVPAFLIGVLVAGTSVRAETDRMPEQRLTVREVAAQLRFIASDELEGRRTGTSGNAVAARYLAEQFRSWGLQPAGSQEGFLQPVPLESQDPPAAATITAGDLELCIERDFVVLRGTARLNTSGVRAGHGLVDEGSAVDDYAGLDVRGKIVVVRFGAPAQMVDPENPGRPWAALKRQLARERGAVGILEILPRHLWRRFSGLLAGPRIVPLEMAAPENGSFFHALVRRPAGEDPDWTELSLDVPPLDSKTLVTANVVGMIAGTDADLFDEYLVLTAHYDHLGRADETDAEEADPIFNGARDNGMGVVALLAAARSLAARPPRRSVLLLATTGEEQGLLGSSYYVENPVVPLHQTSFVLNTDAAGYSDTGVVTIFGLRRISDGSLLRRACARFGLETVPDPAENSDLFYRSDNVSFARKGVPALTFSPGFRTLDQETMRHYHRPSDEADDHFDYAYLLRFSQAFVATARALADAPALPVWARGDEFESAWQALHSESGR